VSSGTSVRRTFAANPCELRVISAWWRQWADNEGLSSDTRERGELCLNEAIGNIVEHGGDQEAPLVDIVVEPAEQSVLITVIDSGQPFDPLQHPSDDRSTSLEAPPIRGRGIQMMRTFADLVKYRRDRDQNVLTFSFKR